MQDNKHLNGYIADPDEDEIDDYEYDTPVDDDIELETPPSSTDDSDADNDPSTENTDAAADDTETDDTDDAPAKYYPACRYCGQIKLPFGMYASQAAANEAATRECNCSDARIYQAEIERKEKRDQNIKRLTQRLDDLSEYCEKRSVDLDGDLYNALFNTSVAVLDNIIDSAQLKFARMRVSVSLNNKGNLAIKFTYTDGATVEV